MTLTRFVVFASVAKHLNITRAAEELRISQPAVSQHLKLLQQDYRVTFYRRKGHGIELTEAGNDFLRKMAPILLEIEKFKRTFRPAAAAQKFPALVVGTSYGPSVSLLPPLLALFEKRHPSVPITLKTNTSTVVERLVLTRRAELALVSRPASSRLVSEPFLKAKLVAFVRKGHPLTRKRVIKLTEFLKSPLVLRRGNDKRGPTERLIAIFKSQGLNPKIAMRSDSTDAVKAAVKRKMGIGILYEDVVENDVKTGDFQLLNVPALKMEGNSYIIYHRDAPLSASAQAFLVLLRKRRAKDLKSGKISPVR